ncbi:MAG: hypothetical protein JXR62_05565 [Bacilli bacterium]|nr:hypothetical protein [Bacilli bacterium]
MSTFLEIIISLLIGVFVGGLMVVANKISMTRFKDQYSEFWTPAKYWVLFISISLIVAGFTLFGYFG